MLHVLLIIWLGTNASVTIGPHVRHICHKSTVQLPAAFAVPNQHRSLLESQPLSFFFVCQSLRLRGSSVHRYLLLVSHVIKFDQHAGIVSCAHAASAMPALSGTACSSFYVAANADIAHQCAGGSQDVAHKPTHARCRGWLPAVHMFKALPSFK